eukprot:Tbor_TRINITY_DN4055_c0_g2::TRINITY_DN4055_c0_g2_i1::g.11696::m.11696/K00326/E1.6.2.2; cytochrome-b5 reductase
MDETPHNTDIIPKESQVTPTFSHHVTATISKTDIPEAPLLITGPEADEFKRQYTRGKKPRFDGYSMKQWSEQLIYREEKNKRSRTFSDKVVSLSPEEVRQHNTPDSLWIVLHGVVYDCTAFQRYHPGGEAILRGCAGRDATDLYDHYHRWVSIASLLGPYEVGRLAGNM